MAPPSIQENRITGGTDLTVSLHDVKTASTLIEDILSKTDVLRQIRKIDIASWATSNEINNNTINASIAADDDDDETASIGSSGSGQSNDNQADMNNEGDIIDEAMDKLCDPLVRLLNGIEAAGGSLEGYLESIGEEDIDGIRPRLFWEALYKHARTLHELRLEFFTHEVQHVLPPQVAFPSLKKLHLNATSAHGDDGTAVESLLKAAPGLENLDFQWPLCDLEGCQIKNITWEYTFSNLTELTLRGYDFKPMAFKAFLKRCNGVQVLSEDVDTERWNSDGESVDLEQYRLEADMLSNVRKLNISADRIVREVQEWSDAEAARPIKHLRVDMSFDGSGALRKLINVGKEIGGIKGLKLLELDGLVKTWRLDDPDSDDDEDDKAQLALGMSRTAKALEDVLPLLPDLQELALGMDSSTIWSRDEATEEFGNPPAAEIKDLRLILGLMGKKGSVKALRIWDPAAKGLPSEVMQDLGDVPEALEYLSWEGVEKQLYKLERVGEKVRAVSCEMLRERKNGDWTDEWVLEY